MMVNIMKSKVWIRMQLKQIADTSGSKMLTVLNHPEIVGGTLFSKSLFTWSNDWVSIQLRVFSVEKERDRDQYCVYSDGNSSFPIIFADLSVRKERLNDLLLKSWITKSINWVTCLPSWTHPLGFKEVVQRIRLLELFFTPLTIPANFWSRREFHVQKPSEDNVSMMPPETTKDMQQCGLSLWGRSHRGTGQTECTEHEYSQPHGQWSSRKFLKYMWVLYSTWECSWRCKSMWTWETWVDFHKSGPEQWTLRTSPAWPSSPKPMQRSEYYAEAVISRSVKGLYLKKNWVTIKWHLPWRDTTLCRSTIILLYFKFIHLQVTSHDILLDLKEGWTETEKAVLTCWRKVMALNSSGKGVQ
jgi:hypothetical protein